MFQKFLNFCNQQFPFVEAVNSTWELYANLFEMWIMATKVVYLENGLIKYNSSYSESDIKNWAICKMWFMEKKSWGNIFAICIMGVCRKVLYNFKEWKNTKWW